MRQSNCHDLAEHGTRHEALCQYFSAVASEAAGMPKGTRAVHQQYKIESRKV